MLEGLRPFLPAVFRLCRSVTSVIVGSLVSLLNGARGRAMRSMEAEAEFDFNEKPFIAIWEATQACDLACVHCRASAQPLRSALELSTTEAQRLIDQIAAMEVPVFAITGGDPLKRPDIFDLVEYAAGRGVHTSLIPSAAPLRTRTVMAALRETRNTCLSMCSRIGCNPVHPSG